MADIFLNIALLITDICCQSQMFAAYLEREINLYKCTNGV